MPRKIIVLTSTYPRWAGDSEPAFVHELALRFASKCEVHVIAPHANGARAAETIDGVNVHRFRYAPADFEQLAYEGGISERLNSRLWRYILIPLFLLSQLISCCRMMWRYPQAIVHAHWIFPQAFIAVVARMLTLSATPVVCTVHGSDWYQLRGIFWRVIKRFTLGRCAAVAPVSSVLRAEIEKSGWVRGQLTQAMPMGVDLPLGVKPQAKRGRELLFVGRLTQQKGLDTLIDGLSFLKKGGCSPQLTIAGGGAQRSAYEQRVAELGLSSNVTFLGPVAHDEVYALMASSRICVVPSEDDEGLGLVLLEALACGSIVVASDIRVFQEMLSNIKEQGEIFRAGDSVELAQAIKNALQRVVSQEFDSHAIMHKYGWSVAFDRYNSLFDRFDAG